MGITGLISSLTTVSDSFTVISDWLTFFDLNDEIRSGSSLFLTKTLSLFDDETSELNCEEGIFDQKSFFFSGIAHGNFA